MKFAEFRNLEVSELKRKLVDSHGELMNLRFQRSMGQLKNVRRPSQVRKNIARILTILNEKTKVPQNSIEKKDK